MGSVFSTCYMLMHPKKTQAALIAHDVISELKNFVQQLSFRLPISFDIWRFNVSDEAETYIAESITSLLINFYKENDISVHNLNGFYETYLSFHIAYAIISKMLDPTYIFQIVDSVSIDKVIWKKPQMEKKKMLDFVKVFYIFPDLHIMETTENSSEHILLNKKMTTILKKTLNSLNIYEIIKCCHNEFINVSQVKNNETNRLIKNNM